MNHAVDLRDWARTEVGWDPSDATDEKDGRPDATMVPYVEALLANGVYTYQSCAGHADENGLHCGHLWFNAPVFYPDRAVDSAEFESVSRIWGRESFPVWEVVYPGNAEARSSLRAAMAALWYALDLDEGTMP